MKKKYTKEQYYNKLLQMAGFYNKRELLFLLPWFQTGDPFECTDEGLMRALCCFSLETLFLQVLMPGGDWSKAHSLLSREAEMTNLFVAYKGAIASGYWKKIPGKVRFRVSQVLRGLELIIMYLMYRGFFKTTLLSVALSLQELLINPNMRTLVMSGSLDTAESILDSIKSHFISNDRLRYLFPEYCPIANKSGKIEFGTQSEFTLPNRSVIGLREPSVLAASPLTKLVGYHFIKHVYDDLIDQSNVTTPDQLKKAKESYELCLNLFDNNATPFAIFAGTHYHSMDLYMDLKAKQLDGKEYKSTRYNPITQMLEEVKRTVA